MGYHPGALGPWTSAILWVLINETMTISTCRTSPPRSTGGQNSHQICGTFLNQTLVNLLSSSTSWFICQHSRCSLVKPVVTVQPESCFLGSVNWCWSGISSQIPRTQYSCCDSHLSFDSSYLLHRVTGEDLAEGASFWHAFLTPFWGPQTIVIFKRNYVEAMFGLSQIQDKPSKSFDQNQPDIAFGKKLVQSTNVPEVKGYMTKPKPTKISEKHSKILGDVESYGFTYGEAWARPGEASKPEF